jgi:uncharacterized protein GlcG (DUF336 family)
MSSVTYERAVALVAAAVEAAAGHGIRVGVVVLGAAAEPIAVGKMDGAYRTATTLAEKKAFTALNFGVPSAVMVERIQPEARQAVVALADPRLTFIGGGVPIPGEDGAAAGAIGVSGGTAAQDVACCEAALAA